MRRIFLGLLVFFLLLATGKAHAAQEARVTKDGTAIYETRSELSKVIKVVSEGAPLRVSDKPQLGWYKVFIPEDETETQNRKGSFGFIQAEYILTGSTLREYRSAGIQVSKTLKRRSTKSSWVLFGFGSLAFVQPKHLQDQVGAGNSFLKQQIFGGELGYRFFSDITVSFRAAYHLTGQNYTILDVPIEYEVNGLEYFIVVDRTFVNSFPNRLGLSFGVGATPSANFIFKVGKRTTTTGTPFLPSFIVRANYRRYFLQKLAFRMNAGYRFLGQNSLNFGSFKADFIFNGAFLEGGIQLEF